MEIDKAGEVSYVESDKKRYEEILEVSKKALPPTFWKVFQYHLRQSMEKNER